ncbi:hypothetical protein PAECIP111893_04536 [Paenibacillus plantiphilus]|uniref:Uncharacterized protein n=1 Tax=Paenibacillus plantiphilus TaxID=2905650 RepID=A0ABM9CQR2_9BACL|nr:hypothetical protein PAECIP111893_04536 [Paenibacillus plantiphilus]
MQLGTGVLNIFKQGELEKKREGVRPLKFSYLF